MQKYTKIGLSYQNENFTTDNAVPKIKEYGLLLLPQGLYDSAACDLVELTENKVMVAWNLKEKRLDPKAIIEATCPHCDPANAVPGLPGLLAEYLLPTEDFARKPSDTDVEIKLARVAIALERYYLRYQSYPETLDTLVPEFIESIPVDWAYAKRPFYERTPAGRYKLWHVGWNGTDEGGIYRKKNGPSQNLDLNWIYEPIESSPVAPPK